MSLKQYLVKRKYHVIKFKFISSGHIELKAKINGIKGRFILDTGASNSCIGLEEISRFQLHAEASEHVATGAGTTEIETKITKDNHLNIGGLDIAKIDFILIDLSHINEALTKQEAKEVNGILGADILKETKAIIDYNKKKLYLRNP